MPICESAVVHIIDDDTIMQSLLAEMVNSVGLKTLCYNSGNAFLQAYAQLPCECIVSDVRMPGISGIQLQKALKEKFDIVSPLLLITGYADVSSAVEAMKQGAFDYIEKPVNALAFIEKVQAALQQSKQLNKERLQRSARDARLALLTKKEQEVLELLLQGGTSKQIANAMGLSTRTVENHRARLMAKLHVGSSAELMKEFLLTASPDLMQNQI